MIIEEMIKSNKVIGKYGVKFLDDYLLGIKKSDFVMIGAPTGTGKSNLAYNIAFNNAEKLNVHLFALEADTHEPYYRKLFNEYSIRLKQIHNRYADYRDFCQGKFEDPMLVSSIEEELVERYAKLEIHYKDKEFSMYTLNEELNKIATRGMCDMIILDHVDYFDILTDSSENAQVSQIMTELRTIQKEWEIPIVLISHLRKKTSRKIKIPEIEDIFGTSNKQKQMKTVILLAPDYVNSKPTEGMFSTFFSIPKDRMFGANHFIASCTFNTGIGDYEKRYCLMTSKNFGEEIEIWDGKRPKWST